MDREQHTSTVSQAKKENRQQSWSNLLFAGLLSGRQHQASRLYKSACFYLRLDVYPNIARPSSKILVSSQSFGWSESEQPDCPKTVGR
jgi:hypothetical protein